MNFLIQNEKIFLKGMNSPLKVKILNKTLISQDTYIYRCELPLDT